MIIELLNGTRYDIEDYGLGRLTHPISSPEITHNTSDVNGLGDVITDTTIGQRTIPVDFAFVAKGIYDYYLLRDEVNALFTRGEPFYIIFKREPYKRWFVKVEEQFLLPPSPFGGQFTIKFRTVLKYAESIVTTLYSKEWDADVWWWGSGIEWDEPLSYRFTTNKFTVMNLGTAPLEPEVMPMRIVIKANVGSVFRLINLTNFSEYQYNGPLTSNDTLIIDGVMSHKNGVSVFRDTNKKLIYLNPGPNVFEVTGGTVISVDFDFRFPFI